MKLNLDTTTSSQENDVTPSSPKAIHTISGNNEIKINNKNLVFSQLDSKNIDYKGQIVNQNGFNLNIARVVLGQTYTTSKVSDLSNWDLVFAFYESEPSLGSQSYNSSRVVQSNNSTFTAPITGYVAFRSDSSISNIQLEKGLTSTTYVRHKEQAYPINLGDIELCKIGDYQDVLFKNTLNSEYYDSSLDYGKWYLRKSIEKKLFKGRNDEEWHLLSNTNKFYINLNRALIILNKMYSNYYLYNSTGQENLNNGEFTNIGGAGTYLWFRNDDISSVNDFKTWLTTHNTSVYLPLTTPIYEKFNDNIQEQLDNIQYALAYDTQTNISQTNTDLPFIIDAETYVDLTDYVKNKELDLKQLSTFDRTKTQVLKNINGTLTWVDES